MDRMPPPLQPQQPPPARGLPDNPAQGRRPVPNSAATSNGPTPPPPPVPSLRKVPSSTGLSANNAMSPAQVIGLVQDAMRSAIEEESQVAEANAVATGINTGVTVDLSRKNIRELPEEAVDLMKSELQR